MRINIYEFYKCNRLFPRHQILTILFILLVNKPVSSEEWVAFGPSKAAFSSIMIDPLQPDKIYAFGYGNMGYSKNSGRSFEYLQHQATGLRSITLGDVPGLLYAISPRLNDTGPRDASIMTSINYGISWDKISDVPSISPQGDKKTNLLNLVVDPKNKQIFYGIVEYTGEQIYSGRTISRYSKHALIRSIDKGKSWSVVSSLFDGYYPTISIAADEHSTLYVTANLGLYKSVDSGLSWQLIYRVTPYPCDYSSNVRCGLVGITYTKVSPVNSDILYISDFDYSEDFYPTQSNFLRSENGGKSWSVIFDSSLPGIDVNSLIPDSQDENIVYAYGRQYQTDETKISSKHAIVGRSHDKGKTWTIPIDLSKYSRITDLEIDPVNNQHIFVTIDDDVFFSTDGLKTIERSNANARYKGGTIFFGKNNLSRYFLGEDGLYKLNDGGIQWEKRISSCEPPFKVSPVDEKK